jgi:hypothetical protein
LKAVVVVVVTGAKGSLDLVRNGQYLVVGTTKALLTATDDESAIHKVRSMEKFLVMVEYTVNVCTEV